MINKTFKSTATYGYYAYIENYQFVIGEDLPREGGDLYRGEYKGDDTPYMKAIKKDDPKLYNNIVKYFKEEAHKIRNGKRVLQISLDILVGSDCEGTKLAETVEQELNRRGFNVLGASFVDNMTETYIEQYPELLTKEVK